MKYIILALTCCMLMMSRSYSQTLQVITGDSVKITNVNGPAAELIIENSTRNVPGYLFNKSNGRTEFRKALQKVNDSTFIIGADTMKIAAGPFVSLNVNENIPSVKTFAPYVTVPGNFASGTIFSPTFYMSHANATLVTAEFRKPIVTNAGGNTYTTYAARFRDQVYFDSVVRFPGGTFDAFGLRSNNIACLNTAGTFNLYKPSNSSAPELLKIQASYTIYSANARLKAGTLFEDSVIFTGGVQDFAQIKAIPSLIQQGGASGPLRGLYILPGLTGVTDFRGVEVKMDAGNGYAFYASGSAPSRFGGLVQYMGNYGTGFTDRSLVDKGYVDSLLSGTAYWHSQGSAGGISYNNNVGIGGVASADSSVKLVVHGAVVAKRIKVSKSSTDWPDYVFEKNYDLPSLYEIQEFISKNKHLPGLPAAQEVKTNGVDVAAMQTELLKKLEELTLLVIQQEETIQQQTDRIKTLEKKLTKRHQ